MIWPSPPLNRPAPPRVGPKFLAPDDDRTDLLGGLAGHGPYPAWESSGVEPIQAWAGPGASAVEHENLPGREARGRVGGPSADVEVPEGTGAFSWNDVGEGLGNGPQA